MPCFALLLQFKDAKLQVIWKCRWIALERTRQGIYAPSFHTTNFSLWRHLTSDLFKAFHFPTYLPLFYVLKLSHLSRINIFDSKQFPVTMSADSTTPGIINIPSNFQFGPVDFQPKPKTPLSAQQPLLLPSTSKPKNSTQNTPQAPLGVLSNFTGTFAGTGFNTIFRPNSGPQTAPHFQSRSSFLRCPSYSGCERKLSTLSCPHLMCLIPPAPPAPPAPLLSTKTSICAKSTII